MPVIPESRIDIRDQVSLPFIEVQERHWIPAFAGMTKEWVDRLSSGRVRCIAGLLLTCGILAAMLQRVESVVRQFGGVRMTENAEDTAIMFGVILHTTECCSLCRPLKASASVAPDSARFKPRRKEFIHIEPSGPRLPATRSLEPQIIGNRNADTCRFQRRIFQRCPRAIGCTRDKADRGR